MSDGLLGGRYLSGQGSQDHARSECRVRQHRTRKGRFHPLPRSGVAVFVAQKARGGATARQARRPSRRNQAGTGARKERQDRRPPRSGADGHGAGGQRGHFDQRPAPDGRHLAGRPQRRAGAVFVEGLHFAEDPLRRREEAAQTHRAGGAAQEFRRHYPHGGDERFGRRRGTRHPFAGRQVAHGLAERQEIDGSGAAPERAEPRQYHHPRLARLVVLADYGRRRDDVQRDPQLYPRHRPREGEDRQTLSGQGAHFRQFRHLEADQVALRQVRVTETGRLPHHRTYRGDERHRTSIRATAPRPKTTRSRRLWTSIWLRRAKSPASFACAIWAASSSSTSSICTRRSTGRRSTTR